MDVTLDEDRARVAREVANVCLNPAGRPLLPDILSAIVGENWYDSTTDNLQERLIYLLGGFGGADAGDHGDGGDSVRTSMEEVEDGGGDSVRAGGARGDSRDGDSGRVHGVRVDDLQRELDAMQLQLEDAESERDELRELVNDSVPLPRDAEGVLIRLGDMMDTGHSVVRVEAVSPEGFVGWDGDEWVHFASDRYAHHKPSPVLDLLVEMMVGIFGEERTSDPYTYSTLKDYASVLTLREGCDE